MEFARSLRRVAEVINLVSGFTEAAHYIGIILVPTYIFAIIGNVCGALRIHTKDYPLRVKIRNFNLFKLL